MYYIQIFAILIDFEKEDCAFPKTARKDVAS